MNHKIEYAQGRDLDKMKNFNRPRQQIKPHPASKVHWEITKKSGIMNSGLDGMPLFLLDDLLISHSTTTRTESCHFLPPPPSWTKIDIF